MEPPVCQMCHFPLSESFYFCPNCGKKIKEHFSTSLWKQISIYGISLLLPPLGLFPGIKYASQKDTKVRMIGIIAISITIIATILTLWFTYVFVNDAVTKANKQLDQMQGF